MQQLLGSLLRPHTLVLLLALLFVVRVASASTVTLANVTACAQEGCHFDDPSIWSTGAVPTANDTVLLEHTDNSSSQLNVIITSHVHILDLELRQVNLHIAHGASLIANHTTLEHALFNVSGRATIGGIFSATLESNVTVDGELSFNGDRVYFLEGTLLTIIGNFSSNVATTSYSGRIEAINPQSSVLFLHLYIERADTFFLCQPVIYDLEIAPLSNYTFTEGLTAGRLTIPTATTVNIHKHAHIVDAVEYESITSVLNIINAGDDYSPYFGVVTNSMVSWFSSTYNVGSLNIHDSNVTFVSADSIIQTTISIHGTNAIHFIEMVFDKNDTLNFVAGPNAYTKVKASTLNISVPVDIIGDVEVWGTLIIASDVGVTGAITVEEGYMHVYGHTVTTNRVSVGHEQRATLSINDRGVVTAPVSIGSNGTLLGHPLGFVDSDLFNYGTVQVSSDSHITVNGEYYHTYRGKIFVELKHEDSDFGITVNGRAHADQGVIEVQSRERKSMEYKVLSAREIVGAFAKPVLLSSVSDAEEEEELKSTLSSTEVIVSYSYHKHDHEDEGFWHGPWPYILFIGAGIVITVIGVIMYRRSKRGYERVR